LLHICNCPTAQISAFVRGLIPTNQSRQQQQHQPQTQPATTPLPSAGSHYFGSASLGAVMSPLAHVDEETDAHEIELGKQGSSTMSAPDGRGAFKSVPTSSTVV
jgi:hypothetical protein